MRCTVAGSSMRALLVTFMNCVSLITSSFVRCLEADASNASSFESERMSFVAGYTEMRTISASSQNSSLILDKSKPFVITRILRKTPDSLAALIKLQMFLLRSGSPPRNLSSPHRAIRERNESDSTKLSRSGRFASLMNGELVAQLLQRRLQVSVKKNSIDGIRILCSIIALSDVCTRRILRNNPLGADKRRLIRETSPSPTQDSGYSLAASMA